ncbi:MAG: glycosyltransferase WbuB [Frankiales bacterium]|nr:glycosyltransferase WbuB [Frankiales bacterium]
MADTGDNRAATLRVVVHDYSGHPFQVQLSRALAGRGHVVCHQYCSSYVSGHGDMDVRASDPPGLSITGIGLRRPFARYRTGMRVLQELEYAVKAFRAIRRARPDVVVLCNIPLIANYVLVVLLAVRGVPYVFWHQDVYSAAIQETLRSRLPALPAALGGRLAEGMERSIARRAHRVVAITEAFSEKYRQWRLPEQSFVVIPNWAEVEKFTDVAPDRHWLTGEPVLPTVLLYSGTLGLKHDPGLLLDLARAPELADCSVVVLSEGRGREWLAERQATVEPGRLLLRDYVAFSELPGILASADVLISILEPAASRFSVPSKVLTYLCAGRPVLAVMDPANAAASMLAEHGAGLVADPGKRSDVPRLLRDLLDDPDARAAMASSARQTAERLFDIGRITDRFEAVLRVPCGEVARSA